MRLEMKNDYAASLASTVAYCPYIAVLAHFDDAKAIRFTKRGRDLNKNATKLRAICRDIKKELERDASRFAPNSRPFPEHLLEPCSYLEFGHSDGFAFVLADHLPQAVRITAAHDAIDRADVAFCPDVSTFTIPAAKHSFLALDSSKAACWPFVNLHDLHRSIFIGGQPPLCSLVTCRLNLFPSLGHGTLFLERISEAVLFRVRETLTSLLSDTGQVHPEVSSYISTDDILSTSCVICENQSCEDLSVLVFGTNYAIAGLIIPTLRGLTIGDVLQFDEAHHDGVLKRTILNESLGKFHSTILDHARRGVAHPSFPTNMSCLLGNHVFMSTFTSLMADEACLREACKEKVNGVINVRMYCDINPGHEGEVTGEIERLRNLTSPPEPVIPEDVSRHSIAVLTGIHDDAILPHASSAGHSARYVFQHHFPITTQSYFIFLNGCLREIDGSISETGILDISSSISIIIPDLREGSGRYPSVTSKLPSQGILQSIGSRSENHMHGAQMFEEIENAMRAKLSIPDGAGLLKTLRSLKCVPWGLQQSIVYLFEEFFACLRDPLRCDAVLELSDCFVSLGRFIMDLKSQSESAKVEGAAREFISGLRWRNVFVETGLTEFLRGLQAAFALRLDRSLPHHDTRDTAFTFRLGSSKFVSAQDVALKCSLGWFRRSFLQISNYKLDAEAARERFAGITALGLTPRATLRFLAHGDPSGAGLPPYWFTRLEIDSSHLFSPEEIITGLHEVGHLLYFSKFAEADAGEPDKRQSELKHYREIRYAEVFAELITFLLVFNGDAGLFQRYYACRFSQQRDHVIVLDREVLELVGKAKKTQADLHALSDVGLDAIKIACLRLFLVLDLVRTCVDLDSPNELCSRHEYFAQWSADAAKGMATRFVAFAGAAGCFFEGYTSMTNGGEGFSPGELLNWAVDQFDEDCFVQLSKLWTLAIDAVNGFRKMMLAEGTDALPSDMLSLGRLAGAVQKCLSEGRVFRRVFWGAEDGRPLDALATVCAVCYEYIRSTYGTILPGEELYLPEGDDFLPEATYGRYFVDSRRSMLYCVDPEVRGHRILMQISCFKTMADIASFLRSKRLSDMVEATFIRNRPSAND
jgi:hypothetical protein